MSEHLVDLKSGVSTDFMCGADQWRKMELSFEGFGWYTEQGIPSNTVEKDVRQVMFACDAWIVPKDYLITLFAI